MSDCRIMEACRFAGVTLTKACELADVKYGTLYNQIKFGREIPFSTIARISTALDIPLPFFAGDEAVAPLPENPDQWGNAASANSQRGECARAGFAVNTDTVLDWFHKHGGRLENWQWFSDQVDLFHPLEPTDKLMRPIKIGKRSLTAERLMLSGNRD